MENRYSILIAVAFLLLTVGFVYVSIPSLRLALFAVALVACIILSVALHMTVVEMAIPVSSCLVMAVILLRSSRVSASSSSDEESRAPANSPISPMFLSGRRVPTNSTDKPVSGRRAPANSPILSTLLREPSSLSPLQLRHVRFSPNALERVKYDRVSSPLSPLSQFRHLASLPDWKEWKQDVDQFVQPYANDERGTVEQREVVDAFQHAVESNPVDSVNQLENLQEHLGHLQSSPNKSNRRFYAKMMGYISAALGFAALGAGLLGSSETQRWDGRGNVVM